MISQRDFNDATSRKKADMARRLKPKLFRTGKRAGCVRKPGRELPFTLDQFRAWAMEHIGFGGVRCHYCPRTIDILHFEPDHLVPLDQRGSAGLENLVACCEECNRLKGAMPPEDFLALRHFIETELSQAGRADLKKRLLAGAMGIRLRYHLSGGQKAAQGASVGHPAVSSPPRKPPVSIPPRSKDMFDDF